MSETREIKNILVVDDELSLVNLVLRVFKDSIYNIFACTDPVKALNWFKDNPGKINMVVTDQTMPQLDGLSLAQEIHQIRGDIPIILMTGNGQWQSNGYLAGTGITRVIQKPITISQLKRIIEEAFAQPGE